MSSPINPDGRGPRRDRDRDENRPAADPRDRYSYDDVPDDRSYDDSSATRAEGFGARDAYSEEPGYVDGTYGGSDAAVPAADPEAATRETVIAREQEQYGGIKIGSAFFGWLTATGMAVLLTALVAAAGTAVGLATTEDVNRTLNQASSQTVGLPGILMLLAVLFISFYCGGYVAGRMARFNGTRQGVMVWLWTLIIAALVAVLTVTAGERFNILATVNSLPRIPVNEGQLGTTGIFAAIIVAAVALMGAVLGGTAGTHYHRKVDRAGFTPTNEYDED